MLVHLVAVPGTIHLARQAVTAALSGMGRQQCRPSVASRLPG